MRFRRQRVRQAILVSIIWIDHGRWTAVNQTIFLTTISKEFSKKYPTTQVADYRSFIHSILVKHRIYIESLFHRWLINPYKSLFDLFPLQLPITKVSVGFILASMIIGIPMNLLILVLGLSNQMKSHLFLLANMTICDIFLLSNGFLVIKILTEPNWRVSPSNYGFMNFVCKEWGQNNVKQGSNKVKFG